MQSLPPASSKRKRCLLGCSKARDARGQKKRSSNRQNKKKNYGGAKSASDKRMGKRRERDNATPFSSSLFMESIRGFFIFLERCIRRCCVCEQRPGRDRFYALLRLSAGSSPNCRVKRKEKGFFVFLCTCNRLMLPPSP